MLHYFAVTLKFAHVHTVIRGPSMKGNKKLEIPSVDFVCEIDAQVTFALTIDLCSHE